MDKLIEFVGNNYAWFLTITIILLFALIGYIYDNRKSNLKVKDDEEEKEENKATIEEVKTEEQDMIITDNNNPTVLEEETNKISNTE